MITTMRVNSATGLRFRQFYSLTASVIRVIPNGATVTAYDVPRHAVGGYNFQLVEYAGDTAWVASEYLIPPSTTPDPTPTPVPPPVQTAGAWGRHYLGNQGEADVNSDHYAIAKAVDQAGVLATLHARNPNAVYIYRHYLTFAEQDARLQLMNRDMQGALNQWFAEMEPYLTAMPWAYFESLNEVGAPPQYVEFERLRTLRLAQRGIKACVLNLSVARSDAAMWAKCKALVDAVNVSGGLVGEHSYAMGVMSNNAGNSFVDANGNWRGELFPSSIDPDSCWTGLRILTSRKTLAAQGQPQTRMVATELGLGDTSGPGRPGLLNVVTKGWRDCIPLWQRMGWLNGATAEAFYRRQLDWWAKMTGCLGVAYTYGTGGDHTWDVDDVRGAL